jgi:hypothetical protein
MMAGEAFDSVLSYIMIVVLISFPLGIVSFIIKYQNILK